MQQITKPLSGKQVYDKIKGVDLVSRKDDVYTARRTFYYRMGCSEDKIWERIKEAFPNAQLVGMGEHNAAFRGGQSIAQGSHWWVKFKLPEVVSQ